MSRMGTHPVPRRSGVTTLLNAVTFNATTTSSNSSAVDCSRYRKFLLHLQMQSSGTPTDIRFILQFSPDGGTTWHAYDEGLWHSLYYEDADLATAQYECFGGECLGRSVRLRAVATGTSGVATFTITAKLELYN